VRQEITRRTIADMSGDEEPSELESAQWKAVGSTVHALGERAASGGLESDDLQATVEQLKQIPVDHRRILNAIHPPRDAGEHADALVATLRRIPDGWGRWIECDRGWYPLIVEHDARLAAPCLEYVVHQVQEKYGTLRYYAPHRAPSATASTPTRCLEPPTLGGRRAQGSKLGEREGAHPELHRTTSCIVLVELRGPLTHESTLTAGSDTSTSADRRRAISASRSAAACW
jgi:hypothetical protein